jgi:NADH-quinone oxidoreductase subunit A
MPQTYSELYFPILLQALIAAGLAAGLILVSSLLGKRLKNKVKDTAYECGIVATGTARERFSVKFYLVAMLFILFDIEAVFLYPWAVVYRDINTGPLRWFGFIEMVLFVILILAGFFYIYKKGALNWIEPEKANMDPKKVKHAA